ncbi:MAG: hypothetical protein K0Q60_3608 [Microvirga sp.]|jgi:hypothetical protein|nr:hypothetical protein [Microvirga sp.]
MSLIEFFRRWGERRAICRELDALGPEGRAILARDVFVAEEVLGRLAVGRAAPVSELPRLMQLSGLDPADVERRLSPVMRDMQVVCAGCQDARRCGEDLERGDARMAVEGYCPNAPTLEALRRDVRQAGA